MNDTLRMFDMFLYQDFVLHSSILWMAISSSFIIRFEKVYYATREESVILKSTFEVKSTIFHQLTHNYIKNDCAI